VLQLARALSVGRDPAWRRVRWTHLAKAVLMAIVVHDTWTLQRAKSVWMRVARHVTRVRRARRSDTHVSISNFTCARSLAPKWTRADQKKVSSTKILPMNAIQGRIFEHRKTLRW